MTSFPHKLRTFEYQGKTWTVDPRLQEFRFIKYGEMPEFVPFQSEMGNELILALELALL